jgi:hypothetical protein
MTWLILLLALLTSTPAHAEELYYRSNSFGMLLQRVEASRRSESPWVIGVDRGTAGAEVRTLYDKGMEVRRWEISWAADRSQKVEREISAGLIVTRRIYTSTGEMVQEELYKDGALSQKSVYTWAGPRLVRMRIQAADGSDISTEEYRYATSGALREVRRTGAAGGQQSSTYVFGGSGLAEERNAAGTTLFVARYDTRGRVASREQRRDSLVVARENFTYHPETGLLQASVEERPVTGIRIARSYDDAGRIAIESTTVAGVQTETVSWSRDERGRLSAKTRRSAMGLETWRYLTDDNGKVTQEDYTRRGALEKITRYGEANLRTEELYRDGTKFLEVTYDGDARVREVVYDGGRVVRERTYP